MQTKIMINGVIMEEMEYQAQIIEENEPIICKKCMDFGYTEDSQTGKTHTCDCMECENPFDLIDNKII